MRSGISLARCFGLRVTHSAGSIVTHGAIR
jgi:hypothetical protein